MPSRLLFRFSLLLIAIAACAQTGAPRTYTASRRTFTYTLTVFEPPIAIEPDPPRMNQDNAVNRTILYMSRLSKGDIAGVAALTTDPESAVNDHAAGKVDFR